jgi:hypothetical protein
MTADAGSPTPPQAAHFVRQEGPISYLQLRGLALAHKLGVDGSSINEMVGILRSVFSEEWLVGAASEIPRGRGIAFRPHWIGNLVHTAGETQILELLELVQYLKVAASSPVFTTLVEGIKANYHTAILPLAFSHRFIRAGATDLQFEPPATEGRFGDLAFTVDGPRYVVECYRPYFTPDELKDVQMLAFQLLDALENKAVVYSVAVQLNRRPSVADRRELSALVLRMARAVDEEQATVTDAYVCRMATGDYATVSMCRSFATVPGAPRVLLRPTDFPRQDDDPPIFLRRKIGTEAELKHVQTDKEGGIGLSHVGIWLPPEMEQAQPSKKDAEPQLLKLARNLEKKLAQTRDDDGARRILVVNTWLAPQLHRMPAAVLDRVKGKLVTAHERVAAVLLVFRRWNGAENGFRYLIYPLVSDGPHRPPDDFIARLQANELE